MSRLRKPPAINPREWAETYRRMSAVETAFVGRFSFRLTPYWGWFLARWADPDVKKGVGKKSAQVGWTQGVVCNALGHLMHVAKAPCIVMFPKEGSARNFDREKFGPFVEATPVLAPLVPVKSRSKNVTTLFKSFPGGFIKFVGSNSISDVKSTSAKRLIIEEPDDCNLNLRGQGDAIKLLEERGKTYRDVKMLIGGTPSIEGVSSIDDEYEQSDKNRWEVPCPDCGEYQALEWEQVTWLEEADTEHPIFGRAQPETARYRCAHCGALWTDAQKTLAVQRGRPVPQAPFRGVLGLEVNELYAPWHESRLEVLVERWLTAKREEEKGSVEALIVFTNAALGRSWRWKGDTPEADTLAERGEDYAPLTVPAGGLVLTMGVDVQHDRLAVSVEAWGPGEENWLVLFDELHGNPIDKNDGVWDELDRVGFGAYRHESGAMLRVRAISIDAGDGTTAEAVYNWVRTRRRRAGGAELMPIKGAQKADAEIFRRPLPSVDSVKRNTKASRHGLRVFMAGVSRAKDVLLGDRGPGRLALTGRGPGRIHWYRDVRADYLEQLTSEVKAPARTGSKRVWQLRKGRRNEALDTKIYALHAARAIKVHLKREADWQALEAAIRQQGLFAGETESPSDGGAPGEAEHPAEDQAMRDPPAPAAEPRPAPAEKPRQRLGRRPNWITSGLN